MSPRLAFALLLVAGCGAAPAPAPPPPPAATCGGKKMTVRFYDAGQALAAFVELPDGRKLLVDAGESATRPACPACKDWHERVMSSAKRDVGAGKLDLLWITHQHSDHLGGAADVLRTLSVDHYVDNGRDLDKETVKRTRDAATERGVKITVVDDGARALPIAGGADVKLAAVVPAKWPKSCKDNPNDCSIGLRIDYCQSSVLFTGDAETDEEDALDPGGPVSLLQVAHHGSDTSSSDAFLAKAKPSYAIVSSGKKDEGTNKGYCHPRSSTVEKLTKVLGGPGSRKILAFDAAVKCKEAAPSNWKDVPASDKLWFTARDGEVVLRTSGDGSFQ